MPDPRNPDSHEVAETHATPRRPGQRPAGVRPPEYLTPDTPVPAPADAPRPEHDPLGHDPVRYGDWERKGIAVDF